MRDHVEDTRWGRETVLPLGLAALHQQPATPVEVRAGGFSLHSPYLIHGSGPNRSAARRCGITVVYVGAQVRLDPGYRSPMGLDWTSIDLIHCRPRNRATHRFAQTVAG